MGLRVRPCARLWCLGYRCRPNCYSTSPQEQHKIDIAEPYSEESDPNFPNMERLEVETSGDQMEIAITYAHSIELGLENPGLQVLVSFDADRVLCTGFRNVGFVPPTFGIDYEIQLLIDTAGAGFQASLFQTGEDGANPVSMKMGLPQNDMYAKLDDRKILFRVPLRYVYPWDFEGAITVLNFIPGDLSNNLAGPFDRFPDAGAWDLVNNVFLPKQSCQDELIELFDPADDAIASGVGSGINNDELTALSVCRGENALLLTISYDSYELSNNAPTVVILDMDRDVTTGVEWLNAQGMTTIGADYTVETVNVLSDKQYTFLGNVQKNQLVTPLVPLNQLAMTIPLDCIGNPICTAINLMVSTLDNLWVPTTVMDTIPNEGVVTLTVGTCPIEDPCAGVTCVNGQCNDGICVCDAGWTGTDCSASTNLCADVDCVNGQCVDGTCKCDNGWTGPACEEEVIVTGTPCNFLTLILQVLLGWLGFHFCDL